MTTGYGVIAFAASFKITHFGFERHSRRISRDRLIAFRCELLSRILLSKFVEVKLHSRSKVIIESNSSDFSVI